MSNVFTPKQALRRYLKIFVPSMIAYLVFIFMAVRLIKGEIVTGPLMYIAALLPALAALAFLYGWFRYIREMDELQRRVQVEACMAGLAVILALTLTWGILEMFILTLPRVPMFYIFPLYFAAQGLATWRLSKKYGAGGCPL